MMAGRGVDIGPLGGNGLFRGDVSGRTGSGQEQGLRRFRSFALMAIAAAALSSGCAALPGGGPAPLDTYQLSAPDVTSAGGRLRKQILIADPSALKAFDSQNIVVSPRPGE